VLDVLNNIIYHSPDFAPTNGFWMEMQYQELNTYTTTTTGTYAVSSTLAHGSSVQSRLIPVTICSDVTLYQSVILLLLVLVLM
jgi:hypothetical protein